MEDQRKLTWVWRNRQKKQRSQHISDVTRGMVERIRANGFDPAMRVAEALSACVDDDFREHCRVVSFKNRAVLIHVNEPAMVSSIQRNFSQRISEQLRVSLGRGQVQKIVFTFGRDGVFIPPLFQPGTA